MKKIWKISSFIMIFACIFLFNAKNSYAVILDLPEDLTQPFYFGEYLINMPIILAENSVLWDLLEDFNTLTDEDCFAKTVPFVSSNREELERIFPWFGPEDPDESGASNFCSILNVVPGVMAKAISSEGFLSPEEGGLSTNIFDIDVVSNWHIVYPLVFDHPLVRIEFTKSIDLLSYDFVNMVLGFSTAFDANDGFLSFNSEMIQGLKNTGAIITFKNIDNFEDPVILVDGILNEDIISALEYDSEAKTVTFNTAHFTSFEVVERSSIEEDDEDGDDCSKKYRSKSYKQDWEKVKDMKRQNHPEYLKRKMIYKSYKVSGDKAKQQLKISDPETYQLYKEYRRYKKYKKCKD